MASPQSDSPATQGQLDAQTIVDQTAKGLNANCVFQDWSHSRQMDAYRELNKIQAANPNDGIPDLSISFSDSGRSLYRRDGGQMGACAPVNDARENRNKVEAPRQRAARENQSWGSYENYQLKPRESAPERAERLEDIASMALKGDERSRLDLRKELESLARTPKEYRDEVLKKMVDDGTYLANPLNGKPRVEVKLDANGKPESVTFSRRLGIDKQEIPMNKSVDQQVEEAQKGYIEGLRKVTGGLGKFDAEGTMRAYELLEGGTEPTNLRWFHLYRKDQGRPAIDQDKLGH